jgi:DNA-binding response OmpR family regulator
MSTSLANRTILVVEDDPIIGWDLCDTIAAAGATVVGPAHDVESALALVAETQVDAAVLDHLIIGGDSRPIADVLARRGVAFLFHTSHRGDLPERYPAVRILDKPSRPGELLATLASLLATPP